MAGTARVRLEKHLPILALLWVVYSCLFVLVGSAMLLTGTVLMARLLSLNPRPFGFAFFGWRFSHLLLHGLIAGMGLGIVALGLLGMAAGWGLWHRERWGRILALILGVLALIRFPLGTALGIYTLWALAPREAGAEYGRQAVPI